MKKLTWITGILVIGLLCTAPSLSAQSGIGNTFDNTIPQISSGSGVSTASDCNVAAYFAIGKLCQDTGTGKLYKGTGAAIEEIPAPNASTTGSAGSLKSPATTGVTTITGPGAGTTRVKTVRDANDTIYEAGTTLGTFSGSTIPDTQTIPQALQALETAVETKQASNANLTAVAGLTFADVSIIQLTGAGAGAVLTCTANQLIGANAAGDALECKSTLNLSTFNLPSSDADPGTTAGQIKHDSTDTGSNSGGTAKWYDGANPRSFVDTGTNYTIITKTEFLPIAWAVDGATAPNAIAAVTGKEINARSFAEADDVVFWWIVPNDYVGGIKYRVFYALSANANADDTAVFSMAGSIIGNSGDLDGSAGTALTISDELTTDDDQYQYMVTDYSAESNADWSLVVNGLARLNFSHAAASDMAGAGEPLVIGIEIKYKAKIIGFGGY